MEAWRQPFVEAWRQRQDSCNGRRVLFPLAANPFGEQEVLAMAEVLLSGRLTMGDSVERAERMFAEAVGAPFAVMVNSGSSANLLAVAAATNPARPGHLCPGDEVLVPAVCWSTSVFPLTQLGLKPVFVDADPRTFNASIPELERRLSPCVKAVMAVHVLGNSTCMTDLVGFVQAHNLMLIEDTCEGLGSFYVDTTGVQRMLGTAGSFGTFSFYFSHHITSGEGGMVVCKTEADYNLLRCLRAHGWTRHLTNRAQVEAAHPDVDARFLFVNLGFNLRPMEVQGAMLAVQIPKLSEFNACRRANFELFRRTLAGDTAAASRMELMQPSPGTDPAWFGISAVLCTEVAHQRVEFLRYLEARGVENRPIISGNFTRQPCVKLFCADATPADYPGAEALHTRGFFIGVHQLPIAEEDVAELVSIIAAFPWQPNLGLARVH
jgi:CDP-6-deoxy-D-xylo-4-hexulose-3-dehydrase